MVHMNSTDSKTTSSPPWHAPVAKMMDSSPPSKVPEPILPVAGTKRPAPSLLPPFEPLSSSPGFPRPLKRQARAGSVSSSHGARLKYPTPVPTSSTGILSSSPPRVAHAASDATQQPRVPGLARAVSAMSERTPLASVPSIELNENGETLLMGRSSNSSHYQLSGNRLVSRVHVKARYIPSSTPLAPNKIEIICNGWNGLKLHCQGRTWELLKGDSFTSETEGTQIMLDVHEARLMIQWPKKDSRDALGSLSDSSWDDSPRSQVRGAAPGALLQSSPLRRTTRIATPESPTPGTNSSSSSQRMQSLLPGAGSGEIQIFEDPSADEGSPRHGEPGHDVGQSFMTEVTSSFSSDLSDPDDDENEDPDEENDPIVHSFGPFGADLSNRLASITASSPKFPSPSKRPQPRPSLGDRPTNPMPRISEDFLKRAPREEGEVDEYVPLPEDVPTKEEEEEEEEPKAPLVIENPVVSNHVVNQLAYSRLSSTPLSTIMANLPAEEKRDLPKEHLRAIIEGTACIGIIPRQGKDAAGKALESEYYYMPEADDDDSRRLAVTDGLRKPSLRACRKQHKQYYWKRPRTP